MPLKELPADGCDRYDVQVAKPPRVKQVLERLVVVSLPHSEATQGEEEDEDEEKGVRFV